MEIKSGSLYGECRCCLSKGKHRNITKEYTHDGVREVYIQMFLDNMNLFLLNDPRLPPLICAMCVKRLRDVRSFRTLVSNTEQQLIAALNKDTMLIDEATAANSGTLKDHKDVKSEEINTDYLDLVYMEGNKDEFKTELDNGDTPYYSDSETIEIGEINEKSTQKEIRSKLKKKSQNGKKIIKKEYDSESDTPIAVIKMKKDSDNKKIDDSITKQDNKKLRSNMTIIIKHSTILPFKNNFKTQYNCIYCDKFYISFSDLKEHVEKYHNDISDCMIVQSLKSMQDLILSADVSLIKCRLCDAEFKSIEHLMEHLNKLHGKVFHETLRKPSHGILGFDLSSDSLKCHLCSKEFAFFKNLSVHMNEHYGLFVCYICGKKFLSERRMKCHVFSHHNGKSTDTKCKHCGETFKTEASMAYHIKKDHLKRTIKCLKCPLTFPFMNYVSRLNHMAAVHGIKKPQFKCDVCGKEYGNSGSLGAHKRYTHKRTKEHRCDICGYITVHNAVMKRHMDVHNGVKNYECEFCNKKFAKPYTLKLHLRIHLNDKRFACTLCEAAFIQKNSLKNHVKARHPESGIDISKL